MNDFAQLQLNPTKETASSDTATKIKTLFGQILVESGRITHTHVTKIIAAQARYNLRFGDAAIKLGLIDKSDVTKTLAKQFDYTSLKDHKSKLDKRLSVIFNSESSHAESIRSLRSELLMRYFNNSTHRNLALVSTEDNENLALTTANLGVAFSQLGLKTLVIDANLRSPQLCKLFHLRERTPGLADLLAKKENVNAVAIKELNSLWLMPAGTQAPNPQELLASKYFAHSIEELSGDYDITLINTAASSSTRDAHLVATQAGACVVVIKQDTTRVKEIRQLCSSFKVLGVRILGVALLQ